MILSMAMHPVLTVAAVFPAIVLMLYIYRKDRLEKEPKKLLLSLVIKGIFVTFVALILEAIGTAFVGFWYKEGSMSYLVAENFLVIALCEEGAKFFFLKKNTWERPEFNCTFDGVVYAVFLSLGFALWENLAYVFRYGFDVAIVRALTAVPGHACFGIIMGMWYAMARYYEDKDDAKNSDRCQAMAVIMPILIHGAYDLVVNLESTLVEGFFAIFMILMFLSCFSAAKKFAKNDEYFG